MIAQFDDRDAALSDAIKRANVLVDRMAIVKGGDETEGWLSGPYRDLRRDNVGNETFRLVTPDGYVWRLS